jgi:hypothetical protein
MATAPTLDRAGDFAVPPALIEQYAREGAVLIPQPFSDDWIEGLLDAYRRIVRDWEAGSTDYPVTRRNGHVNVQNVVLRHPLYRRWATESAVASIVGQVTQSETVRFYFDNFFVKEGEAGENATMLHHDVPAFGFQGTKLPSFWLALTDVDESNAPLVTYAGSHGDCAHMFRSPVQKPGLPLLPGYREPGEIGPYLEAGGFERKVWPARKGDVIMVHPYTIHGSLPRVAGAGGGERIGFSSRWLGDDVRWRGTVYHEVEASTHPYELPYDSPPPDDLFPVIWTRDKGNVHAETGRFTTHITLEPRKGYHQIA